MISTGVFAQLFFIQINKSTRPGTVPVPPELISEKRMSTTSDIIIQTSPYIKINSVYAKKDGLIYYKKPLTRYTKNPVYIEVEGADVETFSIKEDYSTQWGFASDKDHIFFDGKIADVDKFSFEEIGSGYFKDKDYIYHAKGYTTIYFLVKMIHDIPTFQIFVTGGSGNDYTLDKNGVYYAGERIIGVDPNTFAMISSPAEIGQANGKSSPVLSKFYMHDLNNVIYEGKILPSANVGSFKPISTGVYLQEYGKDKNNVYYRNFLIIGADPETFISLTHQVYEGCAPDKYGIDTESVYYKNKKIEGADPNTFKALFGGYGKDKNNVYLKGVLQENLDSETFTFECNYG